MTTNYQQDFAVPAAGALAENNTWPYVEPSASLQPAVGSGTPTVIQLTGPGIVSANPETAAPNGVAFGGNTTFAVTLSKSAANGLASSVQVTATVTDNADTAQTINDSDLTVTQDSQPASAGVQESYPAATSTAGDVVSIGAHVDGVLTLTATNPGTTVVRFYYEPKGIYSELLVRVIA